MIDDMVERVARAIYDAEDPLSGDHFATILHEHSPFVSAATVPEQLEQVMEMCRSAARAAIAAMRDPSQAMFLAAERAGVSFAGQQRCWPTMIDAALATSPTGIGEDNG